MLLPIKVRFILEIWRQQLPLQSWQYDSYMEEAIVGIEKTAAYFARKWAIMYLWNKINNKMHVSKHK